MNVVFMCTCDEDHGVTVTDAEGVRAGIEGPPVVMLNTSPRRMGPVGLTKKDALRLAATLIEAANQ